MKTKITVIVAFGNNFGIGVNGKLPWKCPEDIEYFRQRVKGQVVVCGRKTYDTLPDSIKEIVGNFVIPTASRLPSDTIDKETFVSSVKDAVHMSRGLAYVMGKEEVLIIGGAQIYNEVIEQGLCTHIEATYFSSIFPQVTAETFLSTKVANELVHYNSKGYNYILDRSYWILSPSNECKFNRYHLISKDYIEEKEIR